MTLNFSKLYHKSDLINNNSQLFNVPGVYIWGFIYEKEGGEIGNPVNFTGNVNPVAHPNKHVFIPYYVGESSGKIKDRFIKEHVRPRINPASKRTRLTLDYIKEFFKDPTFPLNSKPPLGTSFMNDMTINSFRFFSWVQLSQINKDKLQYFNNEIIMQLLYPRNPLLASFNNYANTNFPITLLAININDQQDSLSQLITHHANFFFTFCEFDSPRNVRREIETYTTLTLKGKTLAEITNVPNCLEQIKVGNFHTINDKTGFNIFKQPNQLWVNPQGPFDISNIAFPGYL